MYHIYRGKTHIRNLQRLVNIIIPEGVKTIGNFAFAGNSTLETVDFPNTLTTIGDWAFDSCGMEELFIPKNVMILGEYAFSMGELKKVTFEEGSKVKELPRAVFSMSFLLFNYSFYSSNTS